MSDVSIITDEKSGGIAKLPLAAAGFALIGLADSLYLTVKHVTAEPVPCSILEGCETVLTSPYAELAGVPIAAFGAAAYFVAFSLSVLGAYGNRGAWIAFGVLSFSMAVVSAVLIYLQAFVIGAFCQFCLISAATSFSLFIVFLVSEFLQRRMPRI